MFSFLLLDIDRHPLFNVFCSFTFFFFFLSICLFLQQLSAGSAQHADVAGVRGRRATVEEQLAALQAQLDALSTKVDNIELKPGPPGPPGRDGLDGAR